MRQKKIYLTAKKVWIFRLMIAVPVDQIEYVGMLSRSDMNYITLKNGQHLYVYDDFVSIMRRLHNKAGWEV